MRKRRIIIIGDSFTFGHGCSDREFYYDNNTEKFVGDFHPFRLAIPSKYCWPTLLQEKNNEIEVVNLAKPGNCSQGMFRNLLDYCEKDPLTEDDIVIYSGTFSGRIEIASGSKPEVAVPWVIGWDHHSQLESAIDYNVAKKMYITHLFNDSIGYNQALSSLIAVYGFATMYRAKFIWSMPDDVYPTVVTSKLKPLRVLKITSIANYDFSGTYDYDFNKTCSAIDNHMNNKGHLIYFEREIIPLMQRLL